MRLMGQRLPISAGLGRLPEHRAAGPAQGPPGSGYNQGGQSTSSSPPQEQGLGQGLAPALYPHTDGTGLNDWGGLRSR